MKRRDFFSTPLALPPAGRPPRLPNFTEQYGARTEQHSMSGSRSRRSSKSYYPAATTRSKRPTPSEKLAWPTIKLSTKYAPPLK